MQNKKAIQRYARPLFSYYYRLFSDHDSSCIPMFPVYPHSSVPIYLRSSPLLMSDTLDITVPQKFTRT